VRTAAATTDVATATSMRTAASASAAFCWGRGIGRGRQRGHKNNNSNANAEFRHDSLRFSFRNEALIKSIKFLKYPTRALILLKKAALSPVPNGGAFIIPRPHSWPTAVQQFRSAMSLMGHKRTNRRGPKSNFVCFGPIADKHGSLWIVR
jgi:hypothetical protein